MRTETDWRATFIASAALMLRLKLKRPWRDGWSDAERVLAQSACAQAAEDIEGIDALRVRAEAAEAALAAARVEGDAAGYRRAIDEACAAIDALYAGEGVRTSEGEYTRGKLDGFESAEDAVRALAPVEPVSPADELPRGTP